MLTIGNDVKFIDEYDVTHKGKLTDVLSDAHDDVVLNEGVVEYYSKKTKKYVPVKPKNEDSVFFEVKTNNGFHYVSKDELV
tara:strand:+ start:266 stop:508 length:243 start_codon:yes stop_codon:yes gene_type:complete